jgi:ADP-heptose:LPS heptosyltransferase
VDVIQKKFPSAEIHWVVRDDLSSILELHPHLSRRWPLKKSGGWRELWRTGKALRQENFDFIYDAHCNLRSFILKIFLLFRLGPPLLITRSKERWKRFRLFQWRQNTFPRPYRGALSYLGPLKKIGIETPQLPIIHSWKLADSLNQKIAQSLSLFKGQSFVVLAPSAAWPMKRWPWEHWKKLIPLIPEFRLVVIGGPQDSFCQELSELAPHRIVNLSGKLSLIESCAVVALAQGIVSADTGHLHVADYLGKKGLALMGPTAFGFPTNRNLKVLEVELPCRPCTKDGRGHCSREIYQECLVKITPERVAEELRRLFC